VRQTLKVPALALVGALVLSACGGDAESAADLESERIATEVAEELQEQEEGAVTEAPAETAPPPASTPPAATQRPAPASPSTGGSTPPQQEEVAPTQPAPETESSFVEPEAEPEPVAIPTGSQLTALLQSSLSTRTHEAGDRFRARVTGELLAADGMVLVPEGSMLEGRVLESRASAGADEEAILVLSIESLTMNGGSYPLLASVMEAEMQTSARDSGTRSAAKVATGAAAGAVIGQILGRDTRSTVGGAAAGAAAGAGVAISTRDGHAEIQEGARLVVQINEPVILASGR
jgi:hypothetical protein